jgi:hypothetical protein
LTDRASERHQTAGTQIFLTWLESRSSCRISG